MHILKNIILLLIGILDIIIYIHIFKTRYLDYYQEYQENKKSEEKEEKITFKEEDKIIIRDPKHEYRFINALFNFLMIIIKFFALWFVLFLVCALIFFISILVISFKIIKTGLFFGGIFGILSSLSVITIIFLLIFLNFIFNRPNAKKKMITCFLSAVVILGISIGLTFLGSLDFKVVETLPQNKKTGTLTYEMKDNLYLEFYEVNIEYIEKDIDNIMVEYHINNNCEIRSENYPDSDYIYFYSYCANPFKLINDGFNYLNQKIIIKDFGDIGELKVYASKENIAKLKANRIRSIEDPSNWDE